MAKMKFNDILIDDGLIRGPFGSDMKKSLFVSDEEGSVKVITQENVFFEDQHVGDYYISEDYYKKMQRFEVRDKDFLITCDGTLGKIMFVDVLHRKSVINSSLLIVRLNSKRIDYDYFYYYWKYYLSDVVTKRNVNSCLKHLPSLDVIKNEDIDIPEIHEQKRISSFLKQYDEKIKNNNRLIEVLNNKIKDIYSYCIENSFYCYKKKLSECAIIKTGKRDANYMNPKGQYKFYTCSEEEFKCDSYQFEGKNVLIAGNGSLYVKAVDEQFDAYQRTYVIKPKDETLFGSMFLSCAESLEILRRKSSGSIVKFIKINMIHDIDVYELNKDYLKIINTNLDLIIRLKQESEILNQYLETFSKELLSNTIIIE